MYPNIEAERARAGLAKYEFAMKIGIDRKTLDNWYQNGKIPADKLLKMADLFNVSVDYLLGRTEIRSRIS